MNGKLIKAILVVLLCLRPALFAQELDRDYPLGPIGGSYRVTPNMAIARVTELTPGAPGAVAGLQLNDTIYGAFGKPFSPTGSQHYGVTQDLGFAVDRAEGGTGALPLTVLRPGVGPLTITVNLPAVGAFGPAYPRNSPKHRQLADKACDYIHSVVMGSNGNVDFYTGWMGLVLLGHPNWNDTTGPRPYRLSINKVRDYVVNKINNEPYAPVERAYVDGSPNPSFYEPTPFGNWHTGPWMMFLSEYYKKTGESSILPALQRGAEISANTVQWWKQPVQNGHSPGYDQVAGMCGHGGVVGDYIHLTYSDGINVCAVHNFSGMAFARRAGVDMSVRPRDGHYFGFDLHPGDTIPASIANALPASITLPKYGEDSVRGATISDPFWYDPSLQQKFAMQMNFIVRRSAFYSPGHPEDGMVGYSPSAITSYDAGIRSPGALIGLAMYQKDVGGLDAADLARLESLKGYITRNYMGQQEAHTITLGTFQALASAFLDNRQQRYYMDNWRFFYALSRKATGEPRYFPSRYTAQSLNSDYVAALDVAMAYVVATGGLDLVPGFDVNQLIADFQSPAVTWPSIEAHRMSINTATASMPVVIVNGAGEAQSPGSYIATWTKISGPGTVTFSAPNAATTDMTFSQTGSYRVQLAVTQGGYTLTEPIDVMVSLSVAPSGYKLGSADYQVYTGISGTSIADLTGAAKFPASPDFARTVTSLKGDHGGDNYGARLSGCIVPPVSGSYRFYIASDDSSQLKLNPSGLNPAGASVIASVDGWTSSNQWNKFPSQQSAAMNLSAGAPLYFEALHKEAGGGDNLSIGWSINGGPIEVIDGLHTGSLAPSAMAITQQPQPANITLGSTVTLSITTNGPNPAVYQWRRNGVPFGAPFVSQSTLASASLTISNANGSADADFDCVYTTALGSLTSNSVHVEVTDAGGIVEGGLWREIFTDIGGNSVGNLTGSSKFPYQCDVSGPIGSAEVPSSYGESYGQRLTGWLKPTVSGAYRFFLASDDSSELWLSTSAQPGQKIKIAQVNGAIGEKAWSAGGQSALINLIAGRYYYLEILHKEGGGGDHCAVAWQPPGAPTPANGSGGIPGSYLAYRVGGHYDDMPPASFLPPAFATNPIAGADANEDEAYNGTLAGIATDPDGGTVTYSKVSGPLWLSIASSGTLSGTPTGNDIGNNAWTVRATDNQGSIVDATLAIKVLDVPEDGLLLERYNGIGGTTLANLTSAAAFPNNPSATYRIGSFDIAQNSGENYGIRVRGWLRAPATGSYTFWIASDDQGQLSLSSSADPSSASVIASVEGWTSYQQWDKYPGQQSNVVTLQDGRYYYIEALMKEGTGGDNLTVAWSGPGFGRTIIPAANLIPWSALSAEWAHVDIGTVGVAGGVGRPNNQFAVTGSGSDIWGSEDGFHFLHQTLSGDGEITARVVSIQNTDPWAKAGVMIRESLTASSKHAIMAISSQQGAAFQRRTSTGGSSSHTGISGIAVPYWVRLVRSGNNFTAYRSSDGASWSQVGTEVIPMTGTVHVGLAVTSHNNSTDGQAIFGNVAVTFGPSPMISPYTAFEASHGITGAGFEMDSDGDGIANGIEFVIGSEPGNPRSGAGLLPTVALDDDDLSFTFRRADVSTAEFESRVEYGSDLAGWTRARHGVDGIAIHEDDDGFGLGVDKVIVRIPRRFGSGSNLFVRLRVDTP